MKILRSARDSIFLSNSTKRSQALQCLRQQLPRRNEGISEGFAISER
jgi:hypothetical protein